MNNEYYVTYVMQNIIIKRAGIVKAILQPPFEIYGS